MIRPVLFFFLFAPFLLFSLSVDLRDPVFKDGSLYTEHGGVISGKDLRIQAQKISYIANKSVSAEDDLIFEFGCHLFAGKRLEWNFEEKRGILFCGTVSSSPWFIGGDEIHLNPDGSYTVYNAYLTTDEDQTSFWQLESESATFSENRFIALRSLQFKVKKVPFLWLPALNMDLDTLFDSPFRYMVRFGGSRGTLLGLGYEIFSNRNARLFSRLDWRFKTGFGGGLEFYYKSPNKKMHFESINYASQDNTDYSNRSRLRYRAEGKFSSLYDHDRTSIDFSWDKLSDREMATDYDDKGLQITSAHRTQFAFWRQEKNWILNFLTRLRINNFQTVKQQLPTVSLNFRPLAEDRTGLIFNHFVKASYLELEYTNNSPNSRDYNSPRYELRHTIMRPFHFSGIHLNPQVGGVAIYYGNNRNRHDRWMTLGTAELDINTDFWKNYGNTKHIVTPYLNYTYYTFPTTDPDDHFIFDITDGWYYLNLAKFGFRSSLFAKNGTCPKPLLFTDLYTLTFFNTDAQSARFYKIYTTLTHLLTKRIRHSLNSAWDTSRGMLDHLNYLIEWTINSNSAFTCEWRYRSAYSWRKVDQENFVLDSFRSAHELHNSSLSDQRNTLLFQLFHRLHPNWALNFQSRHGWGRDNQPSYNEFQGSLDGSFRSAWYIRFSFKHKEDDDRFSLNFSLKP